MNTIELEKYLEKFTSPNVTIIVCAIDKLPKKLKNGQSYAIITNLSKSSEFGSHWCALYISSNTNNNKNNFSNKNNERDCTFFDSYGFEPRSWYLTEFIKRNCTRKTYNPCQLQQLNSKVCGMYAACFIVHMINGGRLSSFINKFSKNLLLNDLFIDKNYNYYLRN